MFARKQRKRKKNLNLALRIHRFEGVDFRPSCFRTFQHLRQMHSSNCGIGHRRTKQEPAKKFHQITMFKRPYAIRSNIEKINTTNLEASIDQNSCVHIDVCYAYRSAIRFSWIILFVGAWWLI